jgi:hypothetical protein
MLGLMPTIACAMLRRQSTLDRHKSRAPDLDRVNLARSNATIRRAPGKGRFASERSRSPQVGLTGFESVLRRSTNGFEAAEIGSRRYRCD